MWSASKPTKPRTAPPAWLLSAKALTRLLAAGIPRSLLTADFNRPTTVLIAPHGRDSLVPRATLALTFTSANSLISELKHGRVPNDVRYLILDLEHWKLTPASEKRDPIAALRKAVSAAHAAGKCVMFTPALDLLNNMHHGRAEDFLFDRLLAGPGAAVSDSFEVQAQHLEGTSGAVRLVSGAVAAARSSRPREPVFVGLSSNPGGRHVTPADLLALYEIGRAAGATGYWLNLPAGSVRCPTCGQPQPAVAAAFLEHIAHWSS